jgi:hypothetical protein
MERMYPIWWLQLNSAKERNNNIIKLQRKSNIIDLRCNRNSLGLDFSGSSKETQALSCENKIPIKPQPLIHLCSQNRCVVHRRLQCQRDMEPAVVLVPPPEPQRYSFVKGCKWFEGEYFNRNYHGKGIRRVEKDFVVL